MKSMEETCCVVTVFENENQVDVNDSSRNLDAPGTNKRFSCSGTILNADAGVVICSGLVFSHFILDKGSVSSDYQFLLSHSVSNRFSVYVQSSEPRCPATNRSSGKKASNLKAELLMLVNCLEFQSTFLDVFRDSDKWSFYGGEEDAELNEDVRFLSWFAVLRVPGLTKYGHGETLPWVDSACLERGCVVFACGSPFGTLCPDLFMGTLSKGIVSNLAGKDNAVILTDARCLPGTEGGGVFLKDGGDAYLVGLIVSSLCWKSNEWIGLTLVCSLQLILRNVVMSAHAQDPLKEIFARLPVDPTRGAHEGTRSGVGNHPLVALVDSGQFWGSGILLNCQLMLTCRHVLNGRSRLVVRFKTNGRFVAVTGEVLFSTAVTSPYDVAVVRLQSPLPGVEGPTLASSFKPGEDVYVIGYGVFGKNCGPMVTSGVLSKTFTCRSRPVMLQTTCAVQAGASGGAVVRAQTGELLGLVTSNARDVVSGATYPHLNFSVPASVLEPLLQRFARTGDPAAFRELDATDEGVRRAWRLQTPPQGPPQSRL